MIRHFAVFLHNEVEAHDDEGYGEQDDDEGHGDDKDDSQTEEEDHLAVLQLVLLDVIVVALDEGRDTFVGGVGEFDEQARGVGLPRGAEGAVGPAEEAFGNKDGVDFVGEAHDVALEGALKAVAVEPHVEVDLLDGAL